jgi:hypothetical protein
VPTTRFHARDFLYKILGSVLVVFFLYDLTEIKTDLGQLFDEFNGKLATRISNFSGDLTLVPQHIIELMITPLSA